MTKAELVSKVAQKHPHLSLKKVNEMVDQLLAVMKNTLAAGDRIELRGFGSFGTRQWGERYARNPVTGESWRTKPQRAVYFRAGKELRESVHAESKTQALEVFESE